MSNALHAGQPGLSVAQRVDVTGMRDALHAEWTKLRTVSGPAWLLAGTIVLTVAVSAAAMAAVRCATGTACPVDTAKLSDRNVDGPLNVRLNGNVAFDEPHLVAMR